VVSEDVGVDAGFVAKYRLEQRDCEREVEATSAPSLRAVREVDIVIVIMQSSVDYAQSIPSSHST
jgi:hypothetical protein